MNSLWPELPPFSQFVVAVHEAGHGVSAVRIGVLFKEIAIGEYADRGNGLGHIIFLADPRFAANKTYYGHYLASVFAGDAAVKHFSGGVTNSELTEALELIRQESIGTDLKICAKAAEEHLQISPEGLTACFAGARIRADHLMLELGIHDAIDSVSASLLEKGRLSAVTVRDLCLGCGVKEVWSGPWQAFK